MSQALSDRYTRILLAELRDGRDLTEALRDVTRAHAAEIRALGEVMVLACDPCPHCWGRVIASETVATCTSCGWSYRESPVEPVASRKANA